MLSRVLDLDPVAVTLVDIDADVIEASRRYLPSICRAAFDDPAVRVITDDANLFLAEAEGLDAIIYDLTMHPEALTNTERGTFLGDIFGKVGGSLAPHGVVTMQCCSEFDNETSRLLSAILPEHFSDIEFKKSFIPSFCENWVFASARARMPSQLQKQTPADNGQRAEATM